MLYDLIQTRKGKKTTVMTDSLKKVNDRKKTLKSSQRKGIKGDKVTYDIKESVIMEKFIQRPHGYNISGGKSKTPRVPKK